MNHELSNLMDIEKPRTAPQCCPLDASNLRPAIDFPHWWQRAAELVGLPASAGLESVSVAGVGLAHLQKRLHSLSPPRRALLLAMACLVNPDCAEWLQREHSLHFGQLAAADLGPEVFQTLVGLLATWPSPSGPMQALEHCECPGDWSDLEQLRGQCTTCHKPALF